jgi:multidrug resistance efflux pump
MDPDAITFAVVCATIVGAVGCFVAIGIGAKIMLMRAKHLGEKPVIDDKRLQHLEQAIDAIAIEIERISEGQRFTTKLLSQRAEGGEQKVKDAAWRGDDPSDDLH